MPAVPPALLNRLRDTFARCESFESDRALRAVFVDERISQWTDDLPEATSKGERVRAILKYLADKRNTRGENALVLFLHVLYDPLAPTDALHQELATLAAELEQYAPTPDTPQWDAALDRYREWVKCTYGTMRVLGKWARWLYADYVILQHQLVATGKLPDNTFRFQREGDCLRFFALKNSLGFMDSRFRALSTTVHELGLCGDFRLPGHPLTPTGRRLLAEGDLA